MKLQLLFLSFVTLTLSQSQCPSGYQFFSQANKCFKVYTTPVNYYAAWKQCGLDGGFLATITNAYENYFVGTLLKDTSYYFIGLNWLTSTNWSWLDGSPVSYTNFVGSQGNLSQCAAIQGGTNNWGNVFSSSHPFVCYTHPMQPEKVCPSLCEDGWTHFNETDSCYKTTTGPGMNFSQAEYTCKAANAHLASIHSMNENNFVGGMSATGQAQGWQNQVWIGLTKMSGYWMWTDGSSVGEFHMRKREFQINYNNTWVPDSSPNGTPNDCGYIMSDSLAGNPNGLYKLDWGKTLCSSQLRAFVCKKPSLNVNTGMSF